MQRYENNIKRKVGLPIWKTGENSIGSTLSYIYFAQQFGEVILLMPDQSIREDLDLLILPGGADVAPQRYGEFPNFLTGKPDLQKEYFDVWALPQYIALGVPIAGVCRGHQSLAIHFGSKLYQHMNHETNKTEDPFKCVHKAKIDTNALPNFQQFVDKDILDINSRHHQTVNEGSMPGCLTVIARHSEDNHVEAFTHKTLPIVGFQWHPKSLGL